MSRAVRLNKRHPRLWHEFFRLELFYVMKIRERMSLFGMENSALVNIKRYLLLFIFNGFNLKGYFFKNV